MLLTDTRRNLFRSLESAAIPAAVIEKLASIGVTTLDELRDLWTYGNRALISQFLGDSPLRFVSASPAALIATRGSGSGSSPILSLADLGRAAPLVKHPRGAKLVLSQRQLTASTPEPIAATRAARPSTRPAVSLIDQFPAIRHQKSRSTCVAFASAAWFEFHRDQLSGTANRRHSEQFLYWGCKQIDGVANEEGTWLKFARQVVKRQGVCLNSTWPYNPLPIAGNESQDPPPANAIEEAKQFKATSQKLAPKTAKLRQALDAGRPVVLTVATFASWDFAVPFQTGEIIMPLPGELSDGGHAICVVGYEINPRLPGGGAFIIRNSWGTAFGKQGRFAPGYGTLFFDYINKYGSEAFA